mmetsp:Transcript_83280/g.169810  ORF Transcript_83280/g.169810 Transcript_83280/m.169810 type:complete len:254 (+) Transcript_83280:1615-2376(+)
MLSAVFPGSTKGCSPSRSSFSPQESEFASLHGRNKAGAAHRKQCSYCPKLAGQDEVDAATASHCLHMPGTRFLLCSSTLLLALQLDLHNPKIELSQNQRRISTGAHHRIIIILGGRGCVDLGELLVIRGWLLIRGWFVIRDWVGFLLILHEAIIIHKHPIKVWVIQNHHNFCVSFITFISPKCSLQVLLLLLHIGRVVNHQDFGRLGFAKPHSPVLEQDVIEKLGAMVSTFGIGSAFSLLLSRLTQSIGPKFL